MGESKPIIEEIEKSSSKSPLPPFVKGGEHPWGTIFSPLCEERGGDGGIFWGVQLPFLGQNPR